MTPKTVKALTSEKKLKKKAKAQRCAAKNKASDYASKEVEEERRASKHSDMSIME
jgi:hypothetical protein